jgi:hypothetical protein
LVNKNGFICKVIDDPFEGFKNVTREAVANEENFFHEE